MTMPKKIEQRRWRQHLDVPTEAKDVEDLGRGHPVSLAKGH